MTWTLKSVTGMPLGGVRIPVSDRVAAANAGGVFRLRETGQPGVGLERLWLLSVCLDEVDGAAGNHPTEHNRV